jgi:hypothetical protein
VNINEIPDNLKQKILDAEQKASDSLKKVIGDKE